MRIVSAYKDGWIDPPVMKIMERVQLTGLDFTAVVVTKRDGYEFNPELEKITGPWVLFDFCEYGWDWDQEETILFGVNIFDYEDEFENDWIKLCDWVKDNPPLIYFKRELLEEDRTNRILPIEYPCFYSIPEVQSCKDFYARPIEMSYLWGESHPDRVELHIDLMRNIFGYEYHLLDNAMHIEGCFNDVPAGKRSVWLSQKVPHYARYSMEDVLMIGSASKISISMPGAGVKCFRHAESPINSVMLKLKDKLAWSYPWIDQINCISKPYHQIIENAIHLLCSNKKEKKLYKIYLNGVENCRNYHIDNYVPNYVLAKIEEALCK